MFSSSSSTSSSSSSPSFPPSSSLPLLRSGFFPSSFALVSAPSSLSTSSSAAIIYYVLIKINFIKILKTKILLRIEFTFAKLSKSMKSEFSFFILTVLCLLLLFSTGSLRFNESAFFFTLESDPT